jgi:hypothetical protein
MAEILDTKTIKIRDINGTAYALIPMDWATDLNTTPGTEVTIAKLVGKNGLHYGLWNDQDQPQREQVEL